MTPTRPSLLIAALFVCAAALAGCSSDPKKASPAPACAAGSQGCACREGAACDGELACFNQLCIPRDQVPGNNEQPDVGDNNGAPDGGDNNGQVDMVEPDMVEPDMIDPDMVDPDMDQPDMPDPVEGLGIEVSAVDARACELVLVDPGQKIAQVLFTGSVQGRSLRRGERVAVAFHASADAPMVAGDVGIALREGAQDLQGVSATLGRCFGFAGQVLEGAQVTLFDRR
jgi:hypothetical protein